MAEYDIAQICPNGHVSNDVHIDFPERNKDFCEKCGEKTITQCPSCEKPIRGRLRESMSLSKFEPPAFCRFCGKPFPWTDRKITAAFELATELGGLKNQSAEEFKESLDVVVRDTPRTQIGASKLKNLLSNVGVATAQSIRELIIDITSETAKKIIWPDK